MNATVKISFQPGKKCTFEHIRKVIDFIYQNPKLKLEFNDEITTITGNYVEIMQTITNAVVNTADQDGISDFSFKTQIKFDGK